MSVGRQGLETMNGAVSDAPPEVPREQIPVSPEPTVENQIRLCAWLIAELQFRNLRLATTLATMLAQQMQPQVQQSVLNQLLG